MNIKLDVLVVQLIHIWILFWVFKKLIGNSLIDAISERKAKLAKLDQAEAAYAELIAKAQSERDELVAAGTASKKQLIDEAKSLAEAKKTEILDAAQAQAAHIKAQADQAREAEKWELYAQFESMVKKTASAALKKLIPSKADTYASYLDEINLK